MSSAVIFPAQPEQILKGLGKVWTSLGQEEKQQGKPTVLRACAMTLIIATDDPDGGYSASQTISELMREHPSRGIVLAVSDKAERGLEARVFAQCWKPFGKAQQICCEQIEIIARPENWPKVGPTLTGLIAADLPVIFWCRHKAALSLSATQDQRAGLQAVTGLSTKLIIDTAGENATEAFDLISLLRGDGRVVVADLEWTRLTQWREPIAQVFDNPATQVELADFHTIEIAYAGTQASPSVFYAAGWLSATHGPKVSFVKTEGFGPGLHRITLRSDSEQINFERTGCECMRLHSTKGRQRSYSFNQASLDALMNEELSILGPDPAFNSAFAQGQELIRGR
jgi:glucose-6-phosphate dehydrogenase assembly protein OpcA